VLGANDQHSVLQQMMEAPMKKSVIIHRATDSEETSEVLSKSNFKETKALEGKEFSLLLKTEARAMTESQKEIQNHTMELQLDKMTAFELGQYFMTYKLIVGAMGEFMKINAFNQPGVELGKILAKKMLG
jgi:glucose-6-phosphate isomerase